LFPAPRPTSSLEQHQIKDLLAIESLLKPISTRPAADWVFWTEALLLVSAIFLLPSI
jgi:hypothetical protein